MLSKFKINVASFNPTKVGAVQEIITDYDFLSGAVVNSISVASEVADQPKSLEETIRGAMNRARNAYQNCRYSFGLESGLMAVPFTKTGYMDLCACAIFDGQEYHLGLSSAWEAPLTVTTLMLREGLDMNQAAQQAGLTENAQVGAAEGLIGIMTKGRLNRKAYTKQAIITALIHLENK